MKTSAQFSFRIYRLLLIAYPSEFRDEYGALMAQLFRDRYRDEAKRKRKLAIASHWLAILHDLVVTASKEHSQNLRKGDRFMSNLRRDLVALCASAAIIIAALTLHRYGLSHRVSSILLFGYILDAVIFTGIVGNFIVFLLVKLTKWNSLRIALWTFLIVHALPVIGIGLIGSRIDSQFRLGPTLIGYVVSLMVWLGLHWAWYATKRDVLAKS